MSKLLAALAAVIAPALNYAEMKLESVGASLAAGFSVILLGFTSDQRSIFANVIAFWQAKVAAGATYSEATTASLNEFASDEAAEGRKEIAAILTLLESSATNAK